jgi:hypothetical protein
MIKLKDLLSEDIAFKHGRDSDRPTGAKSVVVFNPSDTYDIKGKTHGLASHAIKHLHEFNPESFSKIAGAVRQIIEKSSDAILLGKNNQPQDRPHGQDQYTVGSIINTLDFINDKVVHGEELNSTEQQIKKYIDRMTSEYEKIVMTTINTAVDVDKMKTAQDIKNTLNTNGAISFYVIARGEYVYAYANLMSGMIILMRQDGTVLTAFKVRAKKKKMNSLARLQYYFSSASAEPANPLVKQALGI